MFRRLTPLSSYLGGIVTGFVLVVTCVCAVNLAVDPYRVFHARWKGNPYPGDPRVIVPGVIRTSDFDAVIAGTSHCDNFLPSQVQQQLGWNALRISLPGSEFPQQVLAVRTAIDTGKVSHVLWGLDLFSFYGHPSHLAGTATDFPLEYYRPTWRLPLNYLLNLQTLEDAVRCLQGRGDHGLELRGTWHLKSTFSEKSTLEASVRLLDTAWNRQRHYEQAGWDTIQANMETQLEPLLREHPEIEFRMFLPPICSLGYLPEFQNGGAPFEERLRFREDLCQRLHQFPNVKLYDFEIASHVSQDLSHCRDLTHYSVEINNWILKQIAADQYRLTPQTLADHQQWFASATREFAEPILAGIHPWSKVLKMDRFPVATAFPPTLQIAEQSPAHRR